jgi:competence protein ComEC
MGVETLKALWQKVPLFWRLAGPGLLLALAAIAFLQGRPDGRLHLYFLAVGQGNGILVVSPSGKTVLIDGGPDATVLLSTLDQQRPFWKPDLDLVLLTETTPACLAGPVAALERYRAHAAGRPGRVQESTGWQRWQTLLAEQSVTPIPLLAGSRLELGDGVVIEVLYPGADPLPEVEPAGRDDALVLRLSYGQFSALLPTAAGPAGQQALLAQGAALQSTVLLVPRQAAEKALDPAFLQAVLPAVAVASAGSGYHQGPDARTLALAHEAGGALYRTDRQGTVEVVTDGREAWVWTER